MLESFLLFVKLFAVSVFCYYIKKTSNESWIQVTSILVVIGSIVSMLVLIILSMINM